MFVRHLSLTNFRNYARLELELPSSIVVVRGDNAQGKSNLLEAIYLLATSRSPRTTRERELINWDAFKDDLPTCRVVADVERAQGRSKLEIAVMSKPGQEVAGILSPMLSDSRAAGVQKRIRVNSVVRRAVDLVGQVNVVMFTAEDIDLVAGEPALRRRYLDIANSQVDRNYLLQLQHYSRVLEHRNQLLRMIGEGRAKQDELAFWDDGLVKSGAYIMLERARTVAMLNNLAQEIHPALSGRREDLKLAYLKSIDKGMPGNGWTLEEIGRDFARALLEVRGREIAQGVSLAGPHRDDVRFLVNGADIAVFGSRGQQRTVALSLRLAECRFMLDRVKDSPALLLDDVMSELDAERRRSLLDAVEGYNQVLVTATHLDDISQRVMEKASLFNVVSGNVEPLPRNAAR